MMIKSVSNIIRVHVWGGVLNEVEAQVDISLRHQIGDDILDQVTNPVQNQVREHVMMAICDLNVNRLVPLAAMH